MTLTVGDCTIERRTIRHCGKCGQQEVEGIHIELEVVPSDVFVCIDCFARALKLPTDDKVDRLRVLIADVEHELARCRFPKAELLERLKREAGGL